MISLFFPFYTHVKKIIDIVFGSWYDPFRRSHQLRDLPMYKVTPATKYLSLIATFSVVSIYGATVPHPTDVAPTIDLVEVFNSCPIIYGLLISMSIAAMIIWLYSIFTLRMSEMMPTSFTHHVRELLYEKHFEEALDVCRKENHFASKIIASGIAARPHGPQVMMDIIQAEGRRQGNALWQRIALLNEIAVLAPMLGLLGTVLGLFFAFYDNNRTSESIASIFDGLGIAIGTTVVGLIVAILAMILYTTLKFRVVNVLNSIENESLAIVNMIEINATNDGY